MPAINGVAKPASPRCGRRSKTGEAKSQTDPLNSRIDGLLATVLLGAGYRRINRLPATPSIGVASHEFLLRAGNAMMERVEAQWMSPALSVLQGRYAIERAKIEVMRASPSANGKNGHPDEAVMDVRLGSQALPKWLHIAALLPLHEYTVVGAKDVLRLAPGYENLVLSIPRLNRWLADHEQSVRISFAKGRSFSEEAMAVFDADIKAMGKESLLQEVRAVQEQVALIDVQDSIAYWLVLPDKRMVLWRFHTLPNVAPADSRLGLLKWTQASFTTIERVDSWWPWRHCAGSVVSAEGNLVQ